jgi:hypothetical protein
MKPVSADIPEPLAQPAEPIPPRVPSRPRTGEATRVRAALASFALFLVLVAGAFLLRDAAAPFRTATPERVDRHAVGTIKLAPEGGLCRQMTLDNRTGQMVNHGRLPCDQSPLSDPAEQLRARYSGNRLEGIRDWFRSR